jgi:hypothetical protein
VELIDGDVAVGRRGVGVDESGLRAIDSRPRSPSVVIATRKNVPDRRPSRTTTTLPPRWTTKSRWVSRGGAAT